MSKFQNHSKPIISLQSIEKDLDRWADKVARTESWSPTPVVRGMDQAQEYVFQAYLDKKRYTPIVEYLLTCWNWDWTSENPFLEKALSALQTDGESEKLKRLWRGIIAVQRGHFWELHSQRTHIKGIEKSLTAVKKLTLGSMDRFRSMMIDINETREFQKLDEEMQLLEREERRKISEKPIPKKMTEDVFWEMIAKSKTDATSVAEQIENLTTELENFSAPQIKRFQKMVEDKLMELNHWDVWALAFLAQDGCSDDAFLDFRAWLILQGQEIFRTSLNNIREVINSVPPGTKTEAGALLGVAAVAYEARSGEPLPFPKRKISPVRGNPWQEEELAVRYPEIFSHYRTNIQA